MTVASLALQGTPVGPLEIVRATERKSYTTPQYGYETLAGNSDDTNIKFFVSELRAQHIDDFPELHVHDSQDFLLVLEGAIDASFEHQPLFRLDVGDSLAFDGRVPHAFANARTDGGENAKILWVSRALA